VTEKIRIVLADDHPIVLDGLRNLIRAEPDFELVGEAASGLSALKIIREQRPDVAVLDISMPELNGILLSRRLAGEMPALRLLVLTLHEDRAYLNQALEAGVRGYVLKRSAVENLVQAIRAVMVGGLFAGLHHSEAAHFSFLIATPIIAGSFVLGTACVLIFVKPGDIDLISPVTQVLSRGLQAAGIPSSATSIVGIFGN